MKKITYVFWSLDALLFIALAILTGLNHNWIAMCLSSIIPVLISHIICLKIIVEKCETEPSNKKSKQNSEWFTDIEHEKLSGNEQKINSDIIH